MPELNAFAGLITGQDPPHQNWRQIHWHLITADEQKHFGHDGFRKCHQKQGDVSVSGDKCSSGAIFRRGNRHQPRGYKLKPKIEEKSKTKPPDKSQRFI